MQLTPRYQTEVQDKTHFRSSVNGHVVIVVMNIDLRMPCEAPVQEGSKWTGSHARAHFNTGYKALPYRKMLLANKV